MNTASAFRLARSHAGWLWAALVLHALGTAALQFGSDYVDIFETRLDWTLRMTILAALAFGLIQLSALLIRRVAGAEIAASMRRRMLLATLVLGVAGALSIASERTSTILFGLLIGLAWRKWTRIPLLLILGAFIVSVLGFELHRAVLKLLRELDLTMGYPVNRVVFAAQFGLMWSLLAGAAFALLVTLAPADSWEVWREESTRQAALMPFPRLIPRVLLALAVAGGLGVVYAQGTQNCRWIDRATGRSGCVATLSFSLMVNTRLAFTSDGASLLATNSKEVFIYDFPSRRLLQTWTLPDDLLMHASAIADGGHIALSINSLESNSTIVDIYRRGETTPFQTIAISETAFPRLWFASDDRSLLIDDTIWDIATGARLGPVDSDTRASYRTDSFRIGSRDRQYGIYRTRHDGSMGEFIAPIAIESPRGLITTAFSPDSSLLAAASSYNSPQIDILSTSDGSLVERFALQPIDDFDIDALAFTPDNRYLLVARQFRRSIEIYRLP